MSADDETLIARARKARVDSMQRHVLVCTAGDCPSGEAVATAMKHGVAEWKPLLRRPTAAPVEAGPGGVRRKGGFHHPGRLAAAIKRRADEEAVMAQLRPWASSPSHDPNALGFRDKQGNEIAAQAPYDDRAMRQYVAASKAQFDAWAIRSSGCNCT